MSSDSEIIARPDFPVYSISIISDRYLIIGGGGGAAKTGIKNKFDIYELSHNGICTSSETLLSHDVGDLCISNLSAWCSTNNSNKSFAPSITLAFGQEEKCSLVELNPTLNQPINSTNLPSTDDSGTNKGNARKRKDSAKNDNDKSSSNTNTDETSPPYLSQKSISFDVQQKEIVETVFRNPKQKIEDTYQRTVKVSPNRLVLATGGTDGHVRLWNLPDMSKLQDITAHEKEVDDLDFRPDSKHVVSVSKLSKQCIVWNVKDGKEVKELGLPTNGIKYIFFRARYGCIEGNSRNTCLFTISNPAFGSKAPSILTKWCGINYKPEKSQTLKGTLSCMALSDNGNFLAVGTMSGNIHLMISFSLQTLRIVEKAHGMFVTGLEWLPIESDTSKMVRGFSEASVVSVSCDNTVKIHHIPRRGTIPFWLIVLMAIITLVGTFIGLSVVGL